MRNKAPSQQRAKDKNPQVEQHAAGPNAASLMPPAAYGMDFLDHHDVFPTIQRKARSVTSADTPDAYSHNRTGLPAALKAGIESLSGFSLDDVRVHTNSSKPAQLQALAYTQGTDIHVAPGQERHLPHEAWHVVQQAQGRVQPTMQMKGGVQINDDNGLEHEADVMGSRAIQHKPYLSNPIGGAVHVETLGQNAPDVAQFVKPKAAPTGKKKPELGLAKKQQHHDRPEHAERTRLQSQHVMDGMGRKEAKRLAKKELKKKR